MHFGTDINSDGMVTNKNTQFNLPNDSSLKIHVNVFDSKGKSLGFSKANVFIVQKDSKLNDLAVIVDEYMDQIDPKSWGFSFFFIVNTTGIYSVTVNDENKQYMNSGYVIIK